MANKISVLIDVTVDKANRSIDSFRKAINDADGAAGKFKAGASQAFAGIKANAGEFALAAGAAMVAFGAKSVAAFNDTALAAGKMRDSLGVTAEEASRLIEVSEDLSIGADTLERSIGIMNHTATNTPGHFAAIGAELVKNADGTTNVNETFLSTIDALNKIPDASARAAAAQKVFGRGWMEMSELIGLGADGVRQALDSVEAGKVIDDSEVARARKYRDTLDELKGTVEELQITVGGVLVPALTDAAESLLTFKSAAEDVADFIPGPLKTALGVLADQVERSMQPWKYYTDVKNVLTDTTETVGTLGESITDFNAELGNSPNIMSDVEIAAGRMAAEIDDVTDSFADLKDEIADENAYLDAADGFDNVRQAAFDAYTQAASGSDTAEQAARDYQRAINDQQLEILGLIEQLGNVPPQTTAKILAELDQGNVDEAERILASLARTRATELLVFPKLAGAVPNKIPFTVAAPRGATGGIVNRPTMALIGEAGPEAVVPLNKTPGNGPLPAGGLGGGTTIHLTVNSLDARNAGKQIKQALDEYYRSGGPR